MLRAYEPMHSGALVILVSIRRGILEKLVRTSLPISSVLKTGGRHTPYTRVYPKTPLDTQAIDESLIQASNGDLYQRTDQWRNPPQKVLIQRYIHFARLIHSA